MIIALLNQKGGAGTSTLARHLAGAWASQGRRVILIDADPQGSALDCSKRRSHEGQPRLFSNIVITLDLRGRVKITAFRRGITVAVMLREMLARKFPPAEGDQP